MNEACERYLQDPEGNPGHPDSCESCRKLASLAFEDGAGASTLRKPIDVATLPVAAWEGASHRSWPLVAGGALFVLAITTSLFAMAGVTPAALSHGINGGMPSMATLVEALRLGGTGLQHAPMGWQAGLAIGVVAINMLLVALLRRAPRGIDV